MRKSNFALRLQPSLLEEARNLAEAEGVALNQLINVAVAEKLSRIFDPAPESKSLLVLFFRKEQESSFSEEKEAKTLLCPARRFQRYGTWPESDC